MNNPFAFYKKAVPLNSGAQIAPHFFYLTSMQYFARLWPCSVHSENLWQ